MSTHRLGCRSSCSTRGISSRSCAARILNTYLFITPARNRPPKRRRADEYVCLCGARRRAGGGIFFVALRRKRPRPPPFSGRQRVDGRLPDAEMAAPRVRGEWAVSEYSQYPRGPCMGTRSVLHPEYCECCKRRGEYSQYPLRTRPCAGVLTPGARGAL